MISVTILVKNGERRLQEVLESVKDFPEVVVGDTGSTDRTQEIAQSFPNVKFVSLPFEGFGKSHNVLAKRATHPWILSIDADEVLSSELACEIQELSLDPSTVYSLPFHNYFNGKWIKWCGWHPENNLRLYHRAQTAFSEVMVHECVITSQMRVQKLNYPVFHYSYDSISDFLKKMERYSTLFAEEYAHKRKSSPLIALTHACGAFGKSYVLKLGFLSGFEGFLISFYNAHTAFYKYLKLYEANKKKSLCS